MTSSSFTTQSPAAVNITELLESSSGEDDYEKAVQLAIAAARAACNATSTTEGRSQGTSLFCPKTFDGWSCWEETPAKATAYAPCPWFIPGFDPKLTAHKACLEDGTWFRHPENNMTWSNYTTCVDLDAFTRYKTVVTIYSIGYGLSLLALTLSLIIFCCFQSLQCTRVRIHKNLFVSFIINNCLWLIWYRFVMNEDRPVNELNQISCALLHILVHYFLLANYFWMFCEGFYLHTMLVYAFTRAESTLLRGFYLFGWVGPAVPVAFYAGFRATDKDGTEQRDCWINESKFQMILSVPVCICLILSLAFLVNILRVLLVKLNANRRTFSAVSSTNQNQNLNGGRRRESSAVSENMASLRKLNPGDAEEGEDANTNLCCKQALAMGSLLTQYCVISKVHLENETKTNSSSSSLTNRRKRKQFLTITKQAARATLILIPLLGIHYFIIPLRPDPSSKWAIYYDYVAAVSSSLQGLAVSLLFCFFNGEVIAALRRKFGRAKVNRAEYYEYGRTTTMTMVIRHPSDDEEEEHETPTRNNGTVEPETRL